LQHTKKRKEKDGKGKLNSHSKDTLFLLSQELKCIVYYIERFAVGIYNRFEETIVKTIILDVLQ